LPLHFCRQFSFRIIFFTVHNGASYNEFEAKVIHTSSVAEPHHFYAAPAPGENFDAAPAPAAPAPTLLHSKIKFLKRTKV
jgi:hypothetical protein